MLITSYSSARRDKGYCSFEGSTNISAFTRANPGQEVQLKNSAEGRHRQELGKHLALQKIVQVSAVAPKLAGQSVQNVATACELLLTTDQDPGCSHTTPTCRALVL